MYMPLCRDCHARESKLNADNVFMGDPSKLSVDLENEQFEKKPAADSQQNQTPKTVAGTPSGSIMGTSNSSRDSPNAKSFSSEDSHNNDDKQITLRKINTPVS